MIRLWSVFSVSVASQVPPHVDTLHCSTLRSSLCARCLASCCCCCCCNSLACCCCCCNSLACCCCCCCCNFFNTSCAEVVAALAAVAARRAACCCRCFGSICNALMSARVSTFVLFVEVLPPHVAFAGKGTRVGCCGGNLGDKDGLLLVDTIDDGT